MASSAAQNIQGSAHIHALHGKTHSKTSPEKNADKFADMLADADEAQAAKPAAPKTESRKADKTDKPAADAADAKAADETAPATETAHVAKAETGKADAKSEEKDGDKKEDAAANDNAPVDATAELPQPLQQQQALLKLALEGSQARTPEGEETASVDGLDGAAKAAAPANDVAPAETGKPEHDFKTALHDAKTDMQATPAEAETVKTASTPADAKPVVPDMAALVAPAQIRGAEKTVMAAPTTTPDAAPPQATPDFNQFAVEVAAKSQSGAKQFDIRLDPPELGRVEVRLSIDAHGKAEAHLTADQPQTLDLLRRDSTSLTQALRDAGLNVSQDGLNFSLKSQQQHADDGGRQAHAGRPGFTGKTKDETAHPEAQAYVRRALGIVDIKV